MKTKNKLIIAGVLLALIIVVFITVSYVKSNIADDFEKEITKRVESEMRFKQSVIDYAKLRKERDVLQVDRDKYLTIIQKQKNSAPIIIQKYDDKANVILQLPPSEAYSLFTNNITKLDSNWSRYSLQRFKKGN